MSRSARGAPPGGSGLWLPSMSRSTADTRPRPRLRSRSTSRGAASVLTFAFAVLGRTTLASAEPALPYMPTSILLPSDSEGNSSPVAYIFAPSADSPGAVDFLALNLSSTLRASSLQPTTLTPALPFTGNGTTFAPSLLPNGTIALVVGDCAPGSASYLWTTTPDLTVKKKPEWTRHAITPSSGWDYAQSGPYHLGGILSFSAQLRPVYSPPTLYHYGGMCPFPNSSSSTSSSEEEGGWQSGATYSNRMLRLTSSQGGYELSYAAGAQPVAEAGFTLTSLPPSLTNLSSSSSATSEENSDKRQDIVTQQTSHVMLGGHTRNAFVNMSTAAVWSLPEETWSFVAISSPSSSSTSKPDLARGNANAMSGGTLEVDSRSGHTAVRSADGTRLVVYGGWVGDVHTPAMPQLAVVRVGVVGVRDWSWEIPETEQEGEGADPGGGVYGHGAALLPGNVMMVYGGYEIPGKAQRRGGSGSGSARVFYNITSGRWMEEYVSPLADSGPGNGGGSGAGGGTGSSPGPVDNQPSTSDDSSRKRQIGLGVGLGVGGLLLLLLTALGVRWYRRRQKRRAARDETLRSLAQGVGINGSLPRGLGGEDDEMLEREYGTGLFPWTAAAAREWYTGGGGPYTQGRRSLGYESLRRPGPSLYIPPPPSPSSASSGRLKSARGLHQPTYDFTPLGRARNGIEPIYEADEDEDENGDLGKEGCPLSPDREEHDDVDDPFVTPTTLSSSPRHSNSPTPPPSRGQGQGQGGGQQQDPDVQGWVSDVDAVSSSAIHQHQVSKRSGPASPRQANSKTMGSAGQQQLATTTTSTGRLSPLRRALSIKSTKAAKATPPAGPHRVSPTPNSPTVSVSVSDDGSHRTGSNLSERSRPGTGGSTGGNAAAGAGAEDRVLLSRLHTTLSTTAAAVAAGDTTTTTTTTTTMKTARRRSDSVESTSASGASGKSYSTAKSHLNFAVLREEGPGLLLGTAGTKEGEGEDGEAEEDDYLRADYEPGSPSKTRRSPQTLRRSWLGSLRRVFSGGTPTESSGSSNGNGSGSGSPTREALLWSSSDYYDGLFGTATATTGSGSGSGGGGLQRRRQHQQHQQNELDDWDRDIERAAAHRTVQIMFTVPKEPLRVVNAEIEREESVLIVDPADDSGSGNDDADHRPNQQHLDPPPPPPPPVPLLAAQDDNNNNNGNTDSHSHMDQERERERERNRLSSTTLEPHPTGISPSPSLRAPSPANTLILSTATLHTAEAVRLERPPTKTRVLEMVESIESRSSSSSSSSLRESLIRSDLI